MKNSLVLKKLCTSIFFTAIILLCYGVIGNAAILEDESNGGNNTMSTANILPRNYLNQLVKGSIGTSQDIDYFKFTPTTDINLSFDLSADASGYKTNVEIYQQGVVNRCNYGNVRYDYSVKKNTIKLLYSFKANNTYYIYISNNNSGFYGYNYEFVLTETNYECEPNNTLGSAIGNPFYMITMGTIASENDVDYYSFIPSNSGGYTFDISDSFNGQYLQSYLYDKDSNLIDGGAGATKLIGDNLKAGQIYYIKICSNGSYGISYGIVAKFLRPQYDEVEANNSFNFASPLSNDYYKLNNANLSSSSDLDFYKFIPESNGKYTIESKGTLNTFGQLYNSSMGLISSNDDDGEASNFKISNYSFTAGQTYYLKVSGSTTGDYKLKITPPETIGSDMEGNTLSTPKQFTGGLYSGAINSTSDIDFLTFTVPASGIYTIESTSYMDLDGAIYNKDKQLLMYDVYDFDDIEDVRFYMYLNANESYYLEVSPSYGVTGNYKISVTPGRTLNVPKYNQLPYTNLCWANSAAMIISYYKNDTLNRSIDIAKNSKNSNLPYIFNDGSDPQPIIDAVRNYVGPTYNLNQLTSSSEADKFTFDMVKSCIDKGNPLVYYLKWKLVWGSHFHVIVGYKILNGTEYIIYNDPLDGKQHMMPFDLYINNAEWGYYCSFAIQN